MQYDVFICHASDDKRDFVEPLVSALVKHDLRVWYDRFELSIGDSLRQKIDEGLRDSSYGIVVLSRAFFEKRWPKEELDGLVTRQTAEEKKVILPVWYKVDSNEVAKFSPILAGKLAARSDDGVERIAEQITNVVRGQTPVPQTTAEPSVWGVCRQIIEENDVIRWRELVDRHAAEIASRLRGWMQVNERLFQNAPVILPPDQKARKDALLEAVKTSLPSLAPILSAIQAGREDYWKESVGILQQVARLRNGIMDSSGSTTGIIDLVLYIAGSVGMALIAKTRQLNLARQWAMLNTPGNAPTGPNETTWWQVPTINGWGQRTHNGEPYGFLVSLLDCNELTVFFENNNTFRRLLFAGNLLMSMVEFADHACKRDYDSWLKQEPWVPTVVPMWALMSAADFQNETLRIFKSGREAVSFAYPDGGPEPNEFWLRWQAWKRRSVGFHAHDATSGFRVLGNVCSLRLPDEPPVDS